MLWQGHAGDTGQVHRNSASLVLLLKVALSISQPSPPEQELFLSSLEDDCLQPADIPEPHAVPARPFG